MARDLGRRISEELGIPVYLYGEAALRPDRRDLPAVRRGEYEGLSLEIATLPERFPDFGPPRMGPAGATAVGARPALVAFNVNLTAGLQAAWLSGRCDRAAAAGRPRHRRRPPSPSRPNLPTRTRCHRIRGPVGVRARAAADRVARLCSLRCRPTSLRWRLHPAGAEIARLPLARRDPSLRPQ
jgi:hypothetical protein